MRFRSAPLCITVALILAFGALADELSTARESLVIATQGGLRMDGDRLASSVSTYSKPPTLRCSRSLDARSCPHL